MFWIESIENIPNFLKEQVYFTACDPCSQTLLIYFKTQNKLLSFPSTYCCQSLVSLAHQSVGAVCQLGTPLLSVIFLSLSFFFFFCFLGLHLWHMEVRGVTGAAAAGLPHSHSNTGSQPRLRPTPQLVATLHP